MGLDHGLRKRQYVKNWPHMKAGERYEVNVMRGGTPDKEIRSDRIEYLEEEIITWRKSNQIHRWFVENVQGKDDCGRYYVDRDQVMRLLRTCRQVIAASELVPGKVVNGYTFNDQGEKVYSLQDGKVIKDTSVAKNLLPTQEGFFFGSTDYDEWYFDDLKRTVSVLEDELKSAGAGDDYEYWSSW